MASEIIMPRVGQSVESCVIINWKVKEGDQVTEGQPLCEVETDKATFDVESTATGTLLGIFYPEDSDVPVLEVIAAVGESGEDIESMRPKAAGNHKPPAVEEKTVEKSVPGVAPPAVTAVQEGEHAGISPRARKLAVEKGIDYSLLSGTGPGGRIIERDVMAVKEGTAPLSPAAMAQMTEKGLLAPIAGSGIGGRVLASDLVAPSALVPTAPAGGEYINLRVLASDLAAIIPRTQASAPAEVAEKPVKALPEVSIPDFQGKHEEMPVKGIRKMVAERMLDSLQTTAQLTMNTSADAVALMDFRKKCKAAPENEGLGGVTINDTVMFAVIRTLVEFPELNAYMLPGKIIRFENIHLGFAVDTPRGLMVPVIRDANKLSLKELSAEAKRLGKACQSGSIDPDFLTGGTFTVTNLGAMGIESFTPVLNVPQVGILGVCAIQLKPVMVGKDIKFVPHIGLSLTFDHRATDGAPAARFLKTLTENIAGFGQLI